MKWMIVLLALLSNSWALETNKPAPDFKLKSADTKSGEVTLSQFKGKVVVLEWKNHDCPFVKKHYGSGNMQALQKKYTGMNVIWLSIISSAPGKQGHVTPEQARKDVVTHKSAATSILIDEAGTVGKLYEAKTTPHMYVINKEGVLVYQGAIDDKADADQASVPGAKNYVAEALDLVLSGKPVSHHTTKSYGCSVKYN